MVGKWSDGSDANTPAFLSVILSRKSPFSLLRTPQFPRFSSSLFMTMRILSGIQVFPPQLFDFHPILGESRQKMPPKCRRRRPSRVASDGFRFSDWPAEDLPSGDRPIRSHRPHGPRRNFDECEPISLHVVERAAKKPTERRRAWESGEAAPDVRRWVPARCPKSGRSPLGLPGHEGGAPTSTVMTVRSTRVKYKYCSTCTCTRGGYSSTPRRL